MASLGSEDALTGHCTRRDVLRVAPLLVASLFAGVGCASGSPTAQRASSGELLETPPSGQLPSFVAGREERVGETYRYAVANARDLRYIPCYCGCGNTGHENNYDCYVYRIESDGRVTYSAHAAN